MAAFVFEKPKILNRVRRLRGQIDALERALIAEEGCVEVIRLVTASRGALNGIMAGVLTDHIQTHLFDAERALSVKETTAALELVDVLKSYIR